MTATTCGEATIRLLEKYGVSTVFGIPGMHTLDFCRGLHDQVEHVQARNEQGAGFMAEGWARASGKVGVALVISGPGVTNASTAVGQSYADSLPLLLLSAEAASYTIGKGWGVLHEITVQKKVTEPLTAFSATAYRASDVQAELVTAAELKLPLPIVIWENGGLKQIQDDMDGRNIRRVGVEGINPDFIKLAEACHCHGVDAGSIDQLKTAFTDALAADRPMVIVYH